MSGFIQKIIWRAMLGFVLGILFGATMMFLQSAPETYLGQTGAFALLLYLICCGLYAAIVWVGTVLYDIERLSLFLATAIHFLVMIIGLLLLGYSFGWSVDDVVVWIIFAVYAGIFIIVWLAVYFSTKRRVDKMNRNLAQWKRARRKSGSFNNKNIVNVKETNGEDTL